MMGHIAQAQAFEVDDNLFEAARHYALALDQGEITDSEAAIRAALTFFEAKDNLPGRIQEDEYWYFDRWIAQAAMWGAGPQATFWKAYDAMIYGDGCRVTDAAREWYVQGCQDALLILAVQFPEEFSDAATAFAEQLRTQSTYRERYLYAILGHRFDKVA
ncbi:MAG: hypothetical protein ACRED4_00210 [Brevundimonas sp.]